ncbi:DUF4300 family protein [Corynebacterium sp. HS2168-gen11]|uniref:DUF4300 family protein n=1 Tax=Corynebacterium sp. HS2168-gen11 TaxID=2974027 RepID=UPI00216B292E|nr:DUF4300 family protein [Corynebacterium sp. HS2168-gen11]MCS4534809.1 DUF4300 family protein [Corynebacterium sp. HS2168-gen11]
MSNALTGIQYSNLVDQDSQAEIHTLFAAAGIPDADIRNFIAQVDDFNQHVPHDSLVQAGFVPYTPGEVHYDSAGIIQSWLNTYPTYPGTNCRITTFTLLKSLLNFDTKHRLADPSLLFIDDDAITQKQPPLFPADEHELFHRLFSKVPTTKALETGTHVADIAEFFQAQGIRFTNPNVHMITVFMHDTLEDPAALFVGHAGVAVPDGNGWLFVEKLAFDQPYQALKFASLEQIGTYLSATYDEGAGVDYGRSVIFDNNQLIAGYNINEKTA